MWKHLYVKPFGFFWGSHNFDWDLIKVSQSLSISQIKMSVCTVPTTKFYWPNINASNKMNEPKNKYYNKYIADIACLGISTKWITGYIFITSHMNGRDTIKMTTQNNETRYGFCFFCSVYRSRTTVTSKLHDFRSVECHVIW